MLKIFKNPNIEEFDEISRYVAANNGYCPCKEFREQEEAGYCHCGRYYKDEVNPG